MPVSRPISGRAWLVALIAGVIALGASFLLAMAAALGLFERAAIAQSQLAAVSRIEALILDPAGDRRSLAVSLDLYAASIERERALIAPDAAHGQDGEARDAARLAAMARMPRGEVAPSLRALVARIAERERGEAQGVAQAMAGLRWRMSLLGGLLTLGAVALAGIGGMALLRANRRLADEVAARTRDLSASNARLIEVDRSRRLFFAKASHELRTPVTVLRGEAEVALAAGDPAELRDALDRVVVQAALMGRRIEELLGLARAEDGQILLVADRLDLADIVAAAAQAAAPHARASDVTIAVEAGGALRACGDARWLGQAIVAILDNAVKFSPTNGIVALHACREGKQARIDVEDDGVGLVADDLPRIFDAYYQADIGRSRGGSGLGLALARWVVERHGGTIRAANRSPGGCAITILLPLAP